MKATSQRRKLRNVTWTINAKPCKTLIKSTGADWTKGKRKCANGKVGGPSVG